MKLTDMLLHHSKDIWDAYLDHPFVVEIGKGTLNRKKFENYLIQDYLYLKEYSKVFCMGLIKATTIKEMIFFHEAAGGTLESETAVHIDYLKKFGYKIEDVEKMEAELVTNSYTSYMQGICLKGDLLDIVVAILPCVWSYQYIGEHLFNEYESDLDANFYQLWIEAYSGAEFRETKEQWIAYTNELSKHATEADVERLCDIFRKASLYELEFWHMAWGEKY